MHGWRSLAKARAAIASIFLARQVESFRKFVERVCGVAIETEAEPEDVALFRRTAQLGLQPVPGFENPGQPFTGLDGEADRARVVRDRALHGLADPPGRVR